MKIAGPLALALISAATILAGAQERFDAEAVRLNNRGVAEMSQQFTDRAVASFTEAIKKDPKLAQADINQGIALLTLQKLDEAKQHCARDSLWIRTMLRLGITRAWLSTRATSWSRRWPASSGR